MRRTDAGNAILQRHDGERTNGGPAESSQPFERDAVRPGVRLTGRGIFGAHDEGKNVVEFGERDENLEVRSAKPADDGDASSRGKALERAARAIDEDGSLADVCGVGAVRGQCEKVERRLIERQLLLPGNGTHRNGVRPARAEVPVLLVGKDDALRGKGSGQRVATGAEGVGHHPFELEQDCVYTHVKSPVARLGLGSVGGVEKIDRMDRADAAPGAGEPGTDLHQAAGIPGGHQRGSACLDVTKLWLQDGV